jgi:hypothetical protein
MKTSKSNFSFSLPYFLLALAFFLVEVFIALKVKDSFVRPYLGDYLVVMLVYCSVKAFFNFNYLTTAIGVLLFSYLIETLQYFQFVKVLGLQNNKLASTVIGIGFEWRDLLAYTLGIVTIVLIERIRASK